MKKNFKFIFDMDGTLYSFDKGKSKTFDSSIFYKDLKENILLFFINDLKIQENRAFDKFTEINEKYKGEISIGIKNEFNIDIFKYFEKTWDLKPEKYLNKNLKLKSKLNSLKGQSVLLTAAPRIWTERVLNFLEIFDLFNNIYTGEAKIRKPSSEIFKVIVKDFKTEASNIFSIGDQEYSDITPAKSIGMRTIKIGQGETSADFQAENATDAINILEREGFI